MEIKWLDHLTKSSSLHKYYSDLVNYENSKTNKSIGKDNGRKKQEWQNKLNPGIREKKSVQNTRYLKKKQIIKKTMS